MVNAIAYTIELWMHLGGLLSTQEARVTLGYRPTQLLRFFRAKQPPTCFHNPVVHAMAFTINFGNSLLFH